MSELTPVTRKEQFYDRILQAAESGGGGGGGSTLIEKSISANGIYNASDDSADGYSKVTVDVPNTYTAEDEGKVVDNGALVAQTAMSSEVTENGTVDTTLYNSVTVNVPSGGVEFSNTPNAFTLLKNIQNLYVEVPSGVLSVDTNAFRDCEGLKSIILPNTVTTIKSNAFYGCKNLQSIVMSPNVNSIAGAAFSDCWSLESIEIPSGVSGIQSSAFNNCKSLKSIEIPSGVSSIGVYAFSGCLSLQYIKFKSLDPPTIADSNSFSALPITCIIYVPAGKLSVYTSAANYPDPNTYTYIEY